ncbi:MAG: ribonuclease HII [Patescibacteria group bacterium]
MAKRRYIIGIDEVGRGPLAGPVMVCAALFPSDFPFRLHAKKLGVPLRDSKKLTERARELWDASFRTDMRVAFALASSSSKLIDKTHIGIATLMAVDKALLKLARRYGHKITNAKVFLDGGLYVSPRIIQKLHINTHPRTIIKGDEKIPAIRAASIIAKVARDRLMVNMANQYSGYGFAKHKGYGTKAHIRAIKKRGISAIHRRSFLKI